MKQALARILEKLLTVTAVIVGLIAYEFSDRLFESLLPYAIVLAPVAGAIWWVRRQRYELARANRMAQTNVDAGTGVAEAGAGAKPFASSGLVRK